MHNSILTTQIKQIDFDITYQHKRSSKLIQRKEKLIEKENIYIYIYLPENTVKLFFEKKKKKTYTWLQEKLQNLFSSKQTQKS